MLNYIKAELYRNFNRKYFWFLNITLCVMTLALNIFLKVIAKGNIKLSEIMSVTVSDYGLLFPVLILLMIIDLVNAEEYKNNTLKNIISFGMSKNKLIISKFITIIILAFMTEVFVITVFWGSGALIFGVGSEVSKYIGIIMIRLCAVVPLWIAIIVVGVFLNTLINNYNMFIYAYLGIFIGIPIMIKFFSFFVGKGILKINDWLITGLITVFSNFNATSERMLYADLIGVAYILVFAILSLIIFARKDIK